MASISEDLLSTKDLIENDKNFTREAGDANSEYFKRLESTTVSEYIVGTTGNSIK